MGTVSIPSLCCTVFTDAIQRKSHIITLATNSGSHRGGTLQSVLDGDETCVRTNPTTLSPSHRSQNESRLQGAAPPAWERGRTADN